MSLTTRSASETREQCTATSDTAALVLHERVGIDGVIRHLDRELRIVRTGVDTTWLQK